MATRLFEHVNTVPPEAVREIDLREKQLDLLNSRYQRGRERIAELLNEIEERDRKIYRMVVRNMTQGKNISVIECNHDGVITWRNDTAAEAGFDIGANLADMQCSIREASGVLGTMNTAFARGKPSGMATCRLKCGGPVSMSYWKVPDGYVVYLEPIGSRSKSIY